MYKRGNKFIKDCKYLLELIKKSFKFKIKKL